MAKNHGKDAGAFTGRDQSVFHRSIGHFMGCQSGRDFFGDILHGLGTWFAISTIRESVAKPSVAHPLVRV